ncbi:allergin-1 [Octodon degus]|uniref:Allergin-1 n=1 Tax=Octodon degus TaxID=10160 RepID=A0A6P6EC88_OCTDE|nr:allergin-1 [Octodon degus]
MSHSTRDPSQANQFPSPSLNSSTHPIAMGQNVSLLCSHENKSLSITYSLFLNTTHLKTKKGEGDPVIFNLPISKASDLGPYKCKAQVNNCSKYSPAFYFSVEEGNRCPACLLVVPIAMTLLVLLAVVLPLACLIPKYKEKLRERVGPRTPRKLTCTRTSVQTKQDAPRTFTMLPLCSKKWPPTSWKPVRIVKLHISILNSASEM